jgi:hypothetical protein
VDLDPELKLAVTKIRDSLHDYAKSKGWAVEDYRIKMMLNTEWSTITAIVYCRPFQETVSLEMKIYDEIMDSFEKDLESVPGLNESTYLLIRPLDEYSSAEYKSSLENIIEIDDRFLNPGLKPEDIQSPIVSTM